MKFGSWQTHSPVDPSSLASPYANKQTLFMEMVSERLITNASIYFSLEKQQMWG